MRGHESLHGPCLQYANAANVQLDLLSGCEYWQSKQTDCRSRPEYWNPKRAVRHCKQVKLEQRLLAQRLDERRALEAQVEARAASAGMWREREATMRGPVARPRRAESGTAEGRVTEKS